MYYLDHAEKDVQVYERTCSNSSCDGRLPFDGRSLQILNYNNTVLVSWFVMYHMDSSFIRAHSTFHALASILADDYDPLSYGGERYRPCTIMQCASGYLWVADAASFAARPAPSVGLLTDLWFAWTVLRELPNNLSCPVVGCVCKV